MTGMNDWHGLLAWITGMDYWHGLLAWMTGMEADISYFYILVTDRLTDRRTLVLVKSLSRLKNQNPIHRKSNGKLCESN